MRRSGVQMSETMLSGGILAIVGGYLDVYTYLARGGVFANAQTGNIVLLGVNLAEGNWLKVLSYLLPIIAFALGILLALGIRRRFYGGRLLHWRQITIAIETLALVAVAFLPAGELDIVANTLVSFVCSVQVQSFRKISGNTLATTMCTGNLRSAVDYLYRYRQLKDRALLKKGLQYLAIILFFIVGAIIGSVVTRMFDRYAVLFSCVLLAAVFLLMFAKEATAADDPA